MVDSRINYLVKILTTVVRLNLFFFLINVNFQNWHDQGKLEGKARRRRRERRGIRRRGTRDEEEVERGEGKRENGERGDEEGRGGEGRRREGRRGIFT